MELKNKVALVTGSSDGLGRLISIELAKRGVHVIITGRNEDKLAGVLNELKNICPEGKHSFTVCDLNQPDTVAKTFSKIEKLDVLINNAGVWTEGATVDVAPEKIIELVNVNLASYLLISRTLLPKLIESEFGQLLNVVSVAGYELPAGYFHTIYTATKYGLQGFSEGLTREFENRNLRVMGFYPGGMETNIFKKAGNDYKDHEPWMFDPMESVEAIMFMLTRNKKVNIKRMDLVNQILE